MPQKGRKMSKRLITFAFYAKAAVYLTLAVISIIVGGFFAYLGFTGSWDVITILFSLSGLIGVGMVATLLPLLSQGVPRDVYNPGRAVVPLWSEGEPEFDPYASRDPEWIVRARFNPRDDAEYVEMARNGYGWKHDTFKAFEEWNEKKKAELIEQMEYFQQRRDEVTGWMSSDYIHLDNLYQEAAKQWRKLLKEGIEEQRFAYGRSVSEVSADMVRINWD